MFVTEHDDSAYRVQYRSYRLGTTLALLPPLMLYEHGPALIYGSMDNGTLAGLILGVALPLLGAYLLIEFSSFRFSVSNNQFCWRWRNLVRRKSLEVPLDRVVHVRREAIASGDSSGQRYTYRLVVELDDQSVIGLTRGYSSHHGKQLETIVNQIREYLGHVVPMR